MSMPRKDPILPTSAIRMTAIDKLSENPQLNASYLHAANKALLEIAWLDSDKDRMYAMCTEGVLNSASEYPPDRV